MQESIFFARYFQLVLLAAENFLAIASRCCINIMQLSAYANNLPIMGSGSQPEFLIDCNQVNVSNFLDSRVDVAFFVTISKWSSSDSGVISTKFTVCTF